MLFFQPLQALQNPFMPQASAFDEALMLGQQPMQQGVPSPAGEMPGGGGGSTSSRNLANFNFGNVKTPGGGWASYASREDGLMGVGERVLRYSNAPDRGWHARTIRDVINIYAPASDGNNVGEYSNFIARRMGVSPDAQLNFRDPNVLAGFIESMPIMEHGAKRVSISHDEALAAANRLLMGQRPRMASAPTAAKNIISRWGYR